MCAAADTISGLARAESESGAGPAQSHNLPMAAQRGRNLFIASFLAPAAIIYGLFVVVPLLQAFVLSLYRWRGVSAHKTFIGAQNFGKLWNDEVFWKALKNNLWLMAACGLAVIALGVLIAHGMNSSGRLARLLRSVYLFPQVISLVVVAILWQFLLNPSFGLVNSGLSAMGFRQFENKGWLGDPATALPSVGVAFVWYALGFYVMLFSAGLKSIPDDIKEAAELDGSTGFHRFRTITWPMLWPIKRIATIYVVITVLNIFALPFLMTRGGPDRATESMLTYLYQQAFQNSEFGYATALAVANFVVAMLLAVLILTMYRKDPQGARP